MAIRVGINGFGRTGRAFFRAALRHDLGLEVVAINDLGSPEALARLLARDSVYGRFDQTVATAGNVLVVAGNRILLPAQHEIKALPWAELGVDVVVEATGRFTARELAAGHLDAGAPRVVVSAPSSDADATIVIGVNDDSFDPGAPRCGLQRVVYHQLPGPAGQGPRRRLRSRGRLHDDGPRLYR